MKKRIFVVDADEAVREALGRLLSDVDYEVTLASNAEDALACGELGNMDLMILEINLPTKNGWDTYELVADQFPALPILIIITAQNDFHAESAKTAGVDAYMEKPLDVPKLLQTIQDLLAESDDSRARRLDLRRLGINVISPDGVVFSKPTLHKPYKHLDAHPHLNSFEIGKALRSREKMKIIC